MGAAEAIDKKLKVFKIPSIGDEAQVDALERQTVQWLLEPAPLHVFDFEDVLTIDPKFYRLIAVYRRTLLKNGKHLSSIGLRSQLIFEVTQIGLGPTFAAVESLDKAKQAAGLDGAPKPKPKIDSVVLTPFIEGTINTLQTQAELKIQTGKPFIKDGTEPEIAIAGVITMNNAQLPGSIAICFTTPVFLGIYESMVGEKHTEITADIQDAAGELLNMIYGFAKTKLRAEGIAFDMAIPVILAGDKLKMSMGVRGKSIIIPFECVYGRFHLEVYFKRN